MENYQITALRLIECERNVALYGPGGTGKSYIIQQVPYIVFNNWI